MKRIKVLGSVLKRTRADKIIIGFIVFIFAIAAVIQLVEPDINRYGDALWYCYVVISTAGFGDVVAVTFIGKMCSVLLTIYSLSNSGGKGKYPLNTLQKKSFAAL